MFFPVNINLEFPYELPYVSPNHAVKEMWSSVPYAGEKPTPEELIVWAVIKLIKLMNA